MKSERKELALAKVLAGAAWADGEVTPAESAYLERLAKDLGLTPVELAEVRGILEKPIGMAEIQSLAAEFLSRVGPEERDVLLMRLAGLFESDGRADPAESRLLASLRGSGERISDAPSLLGRVRGLLRAGRTEAAGEPTGVLRELTGRIATPRPQDRAQREIFDRAVLFGAILYRVAFADETVDDAEVAQLRSLLMNTFAFGTEEADHVIGVIRSRVAEDLDRQRLCASFNRTASMDERLRLLGCVFTIAMADGQIDDHELKEIRLIANYLWIDAREFNEIRVKTTRAGAKRGV